MHILFETPATIQLLNYETLTPTATHEFQTPSEATKYFSLCENSCPQILKDFLEKNNVEEIYVCDRNLKKHIEKSTQIKAIFDTKAARKIQQVFSEMFEKNCDDFKMKIMSFAHEKANLKINDYPIKNDVKVVESVKTVDQIEKDLNNAVMRIKEWYGFHFPELAEELSGRDYVKAIAIMGNRKNCWKLSGKKNENDDSDDESDEDDKKEIDDNDKIDDNNEKMEFFSDEIVRKIKKKEKTSFGTEITEDESSKLVACAEEILRMYDHKIDMNKYLKDCINEVAPNTSALLGELPAARMIAKAGSLVDLAKMTASTLQILGSEKAFYNAILNKADTPKYGFIYYSPLVAKASPKFKGRAARSLAAKASLAAKIDAFSNPTDNSMGVKERNKLEKRFLGMEEIISKKKQWNKKNKD